MNELLSYEFLMSRNCAYYKSAERKLARNSESSGVEESGSTRRKVRQGILVRAVELS